MNELRKARVSVARSMRHDTLAESFVDSIEECRRLRRIVKDYTSILGKIVPELVEENDINSIPPYDIISNELKKRGINIDD